MSVEDRERLIEAFVRPFADVAPAVRRGGRPARERPTRWRTIGLATAVLAALVGTIAVVAVRHPPTATPTHAPSPALTRQQVLVSSSGVSIRRGNRTTFAPVVTGRIAGYRYAPDGSALAFIVIQQSECLLDVLSMMTANLRQIATCSSLADDRASKIPVVAAGIRFVSDWPTYGGPGWSPDSRQLSYVCRVGRVSEEVCTVDARTGVVQARFTVPSFWPTWSPSGGTIAYLRIGPAKHPTRYAPADLHVWLVDGDGTNARPVSRVTQSCVCLGLWPTLAWSEDGTKLLFEVHRQEIIDVATGSATCTGAVVTDRSDRLSACEDHGNGTRAAAPVP